MSMDDQSPWDQDQKEQGERHKASDAAAASQAMLTLAHAMQAGLEMPYEELKRRCDERVEKYIGWLAQAAAQFGPEAQKGMMGVSASVDLVWDEAAPMLIRGEARVKTGHCVNCQQFECAPEDAVEASGRGAVRALMNGHSWLCDGFEMDLVEDPAPGFLEVREMLLELPAMGAPGALLAEMVALETRWSSSRWSACAHLEEMVNEAALAGLLPSGFVGSQIRLDEGWPGEATKVVIWDARLEGMGRARGTSALGSLTSCGAFTTDVAWRLPSLDQGPMALWSAFARSAAECHARGWTSMPSSFSSPDAQSAARAAVEARLLGEEAPEQSASTAPQRKLRL